MDTLPNRNIIFNFLSHPDETTQNETQDTIQEDTHNVNSIRNTSVNVSSPTRTTSNNTRYMTRSRYNPLSIPSAFRSNRSIQLDTNHNDNQQTSSKYYDPFNYSFFPSSNTNTYTNNIRNFSQSNTNPITQNQFTHPLQPNLSQNNFHSQNQRTSDSSTPYSHITQPLQRKPQNPPITYISTDPLYQMNQHTTYNSNTNPLPTNMTQPVAPPQAQPVTTPFQYIPKQQDTFLNKSASIPELMKPFDGLAHSYTPEEYLQQFEARLTFAIGEEPQNNPIKNRSWHNRRIANIQCSLTGTALDWNSP